MKLRIGERINDEAEFEPKTLAPRDVAMSVPSLPVRSRKWLVRGAMYTSSTQVGLVQDVTDLVKMAAHSCYRDFQAAIF